MTITNDPAGAAVPLDQPLRHATMGQAASRFWRKYATFSGRASQSEFWFAVLVVLGGLYLGDFVLPVPLFLLPEPGYTVVSIVLLVLLYACVLAVIVPLLAVTWRRLHDVNSSGGLFFFGLIPLIGPIMLLINLAGAPDPEGVRFDKRLAVVGPMSGVGAEQVAPTRP